MEPAIEGPRIYNLFPPLAGPLPEWEPHLRRAARMGFNAVFVNPFHLPGSSGSIYAIKDYYSLNPLLVGDAAEEPAAQLRHVAEQVHALSMEFLMDLVINHTAIDSPLIQEHPDWYQRDASGGIVHPGADENGHRVIWNDLAAVDNAGSPDRTELWQYWLQLVCRHAELGFDGFRCDAAYQVPSELWRFLIESARGPYPHLRFFAETLGCSPEQTVEVARTGFDFVFNSSKWWDFTAPWCLEQYQFFAPAVRTISFPESHDTERLAAEVNGSRAAVRQRYVFAALFSSGVMMPIGFEYGFRRPLRVVSTRPRDWEEPSWDDSAFIGSVNTLKAAHRIWNEEGPARAVESGNPSVLALYKTSCDGQQRAVLLFNKNREQPESADLEPAKQLLGGSMRDLSTLLSGASSPAVDSAPLLEPSGFRILLSE